MKSKYLLYLFICLIIIGISYYIYGKTVGFYCTFVIENNMQTWDENNIAPENPDITIIINSDTLATVNIASNQIHRPITYNKRLNFGYSAIEVYSDSMMIYAVEGLNIYNNRKINIGLFQSMQRNHLSISIN